jgi:hypothetical protein
MPTAAICNRNAENVTDYTLAVDVQIQRRYPSHGHMPNKCPVCEGAAMAAGATFGSTPWGQRIGLIAPRPATPPARPHELPAILMMEIPMSFQGHTMNIHIRRFAVLFVAALFVVTTGLPAAQAANEKASCVGLIVSAEAAAGQLDVNTYKDLAEADGLPNFGQFVAGGAQLHLGSPEACAP